MNGLGSSHSFFCRNITSTASTCFLGQRSQRLKLSLRIASGISRKIHVAFHGECFISSDLPSASRQSSSTCGESITPSLMNETKHTRRRRLSGSWDNDGRQTVGRCCLPRPAGGGPTPRAGAKEKDRVQEHRSCAFPPGGGARPGNPHHVGTRTRAWARSLPGGPVALSPARTLLLHRHPGSTPVWWVGSRNRLASVKLPFHWQGQLHHVLQL
jgi:hypothetical protein